MKLLEEFVNEKLKVGRNTIYHPNSKEELVQLMIEEIKTNGAECSLNHIDVSHIDDMSFLFRGGDRFKYYSGHPVLSGFDGDISDWDVSNVKDMRAMFARSKFNGDISDWDVSNVMDMHGMFYGSDFNGDISNWDVSNVKDINSMFDSSPLENNPPAWYKK